MAFDPGKLKQSLSQSKTQSTNNALFQTINNLIEALQEVKDSIQAPGDLDATINEIIASRKTIKLIEPNTAVSPQTRILADDVPFDQMVVYKDYQGNAAANNINFTGAVDGAGVSITTNFGVLRVYKSNKDGLFKEW